MRTEGRFRPHYVAGGHFFEIGKPFYAGSDRDD